MRKINVSRTFVAISSLIALTVLMTFQNCSEVSFQKADSTLDAGKSSDTGSTTQGSNDTGQDDPVDDPTVDNPDDNVCNPLNPTEPCYVGQNSGLVGKLYYLSDEHASLFGNDLNNAKINDYRIYGIQVPVDILMSSINVPQRSWELGFQLPNGEKVKKENGVELFEWFHLDMNGFLQLPSGQYKFATISDDGIRVTIEDQVIINHDGVHAPSFKCSNTVITFAEGEKKSLRVQYFQGPRYQIAMQLFARKIDPNTEGNCSSNDHFDQIDASAYSH